MKKVAKINEIKEKIAKLQSELEMLQKKVKPIEDKIGELKLKAKPIWMEINDKKESIKELERELKIEEAWDLIRNLKVGDKLWILHSVFPWERGTYETITEERAKLRFEKRRVGESIPHRIEITEVCREGESQFTFFAVDTKTKQKYVGRVIQPSSWDGRAVEPKIVWIRGE